MSVFKIEKNDNYTVMSNYHLRDKNLSYKAKGLLSFMLSLPEDWDYSLAGLCKISKEGREKQNLSMRQLAELAKVSHSDISRIELGEREVPNPKILRKISKYIDVNYNDLMYAAGLGFQVTPLNPFLKRYYSSLKGHELDEALINTLGSIENWEALVKSLRNRVETENISEEEKEIILQTIEDTEYQINSANEIVKLLHSAKTKERIENERKN